MIQIHRTNIAAPVMRPFMLVSGWTGMSLLIRRPGIIILMQANHLPTRRLAMLEGRAVNMPTCDISTPLPSEVMKSQLGHDFKQLPLDLCLIYALQIEFSDIQDRCLSRM